jgi:hypothetical protein
VPERGSSPCPIIYERLNMDSIPETFIRNYVDSLIAVAKELPEQSPMRESIILRANAIMDMVIAFRESCNERRRI